MLRKIVLASILVIGISSYCMGELTDEEISRLGGGELTPIGAEKSGSSDGVIPEWTGGIVKGSDGWYYEGELKVPFAKYNPQKNGLRPDPFGDDKVLYTVTSGNANQHADKLSPGLKELLKKYPEDVKLNVYPSRRSMGYSDRMIEMQKKYSKTAHLEKDGRKLAGARECIPFPIPKNGLEAIWNASVRWSGTVEAFRYKSFMVTASGRPVLTNEAIGYMEYPYWDPTTTKTDTIFMVMDDVVGPPNRVGEGTMGLHPLDKAKGGQPVWQYLPGQRRVKLAPEVSFDGPNFNVAGAGVIDEVYMFNGSPERYDWKILGKKELIIPYNNYKAQFWTKSSDLLGPRFLNPEAMRYEVHRVWVVEGMLKPTSRHIYKKRVMYMDEDSWLIHLADQYDGKGNLWRVKLLPGTFNYDVQAPNSNNDTGFDLVSGIYFMMGHLADTGGIYYVPARDKKYWTPSVLAGRGIR